MAPILRTQRIRTCLGFLACVITFPSGCKRSGDDSSTPTGRAVLTLYCSVDEQFARPIVAMFEKQHGIRVNAIFDTEAGKTTGLINKVIAESRSGRPRADVFWSGELFGTIRLARAGLLAPYSPATAADIPDRYRDPDSRWTAYAVRGRVIAFDPARAPEETRPWRWDQLADPKIASMSALANPLFGTTRGHVASLFALWGEAKARDFLEALRAGGIQIVDGNSTAVRAVMDGRAMFAATDTDDVWVARRAGASLDAIYPDLGDGGTLLIPSSVALIANHPGDNAASRKLIDYLLSAAVEKSLALSDSRNIPVRQALREELGLAWPPESQLSFEAIADWLEKSDAAVRDILLK